MSCCSGCTSGGVAHDPEADPLELSVLEAGETVLKIGLAMRRARAASAAWLVPSRRRDNPEFVISVYGGPNSDIAGPKQDRVRCRLGDRIVHEVRDLFPDTEYTLEFMQAAAMEGQPLRSRTMAQRLEVRTAAASTCQFAGEDWGRSCKDGKDGKDLKKGHKEEPGTHSSSSSSSSSQGLAGATQALLSQLHDGEPSPRQHRAPRSQSGDDCSTNAPSDVGDADHDMDDPQERPDENWEAVEVSARRAPREFSTTSDVQTIELEDAVTTPADSVRSNQCNLWAMWDCIKSGRMSWKRGGKTSQDPNELVVGEESQPQAAVPVQAPQRQQGQQQRRTRMRRPHRPAFPGTEVDPASVGLELLPALNESQFQAVVDDRCRNLR